MTDTSPASSDNALSRSLGVRELAAGIVTITIGGGVFLLPAAVSKSLGAAAWLAYIVCAIVFSLIALCFAEAGSRVQQSGGPYAYVGEAFGPFAGYISGILLLLLGTFAGAAVAAGFTQVVGTLIPGAGEGMARIGLLVLLFGFLTFMNIRGVGQGARVVEITTAAKLIPLIFIGTIGLFFVKGSNLAWPGMPAMSDLFQTSMMLMFAFFGMECALVPSGEVRNPARTVPRAIFLAIGGITLLYLGVQESAQGILGPEMANHADGPLAAAAGVAFGHWASVLLIVGAAVSMLGNTSGVMLSLPRSLFALARDGYLPSILARVNPSTRVPANAILVFAVVVTCLAATGSFTSLATLANISAMLLYLLCCLGVLGLRRNGVRLDADPFMVPGGAVVPWLAAAAICTLLWTVALKDFTGIAIVVVIASIWYLIRRRMKAS